jgi:uncharacterized membrane protein YdfJ with MMPL/SSD domain
MSRNTQHITSGITARAARWSAAHRKAAVLGWLAFVIAAFMIGQAAGVVTLKPGEVGNGQSRLADRTLAQQFPRERAGEQVLLESRSGKLAASGYRAAVADLVARLSRTPSVAQIKSPLAPQNAGQVSKNGRAALVTFQITGDPDTAKDRVGPALAATAAVQAAHPRLYIGEFGDGSVNKAYDKRIAQDFQKAEVTSLPVTLFILVLAFGALVAAGVPLLLGITAVVAALGLTGLLSHLLHVDQMISSVILLVGLAVGVDYSLFYLRREREERGRGRSPAEALEVAAATSGRAILISGFIVIIAMTGMFLMGSQIFTSFGIGTVLVVAISLLGSLTVLPALLSKLGDRVDRGRIPFLQRRRAGAGTSRAWGAVVGVVLRRPVLWGGAAVALLVTLAIPAFSLHTVNSGAQGVPDSLTVKQVYNHIQKTFPGGAGPATVVISAPDVTKPQVTAGIGALKRAALATGVMHEPISVDVSRSRQAARVMIPLAGRGTDDASTHALQRLRGSVIPATIGRVPGVTVHATGWAATSLDFNNSMKSHAPLVFAWVLGLAFLLLLVTFRSIVIPITAIALNLLSVGAAYGVLVLIFQRGHLESLLGFTSMGGITNWLPLFLFVILFGLSMDYHVLILSRIREGYDRGMDTRTAVADGIKGTAGVVTSAAIVMVAVFSIFATLAMIDFKMMGVGLATAILIDATIVRAVLLPAAMSLLGRHNWYLPSWLGWLPQVNAEPSAAAVARPVVTAMRSNSRGRKAARSRIRAWVRAALRDLAYDGAVFVWSIAAFTILVTGVSVTSSLIVLVIGVFVWVAFVYVVRWTTWVDRRLASWQRRERIPSVYRRTSGRGFVPLLKTVSSDPQTWRDLGWLGLTSIAGFTLGLAAITAAGVVIAYISMPIWYWAIFNPEAQHGLTNLGVATVDSLGEAFAMMGIGLLLTPVALLLARVCASVHAGLAARVLGPSPRPEPYPTVAGTTRSPTYSPGS